MIARIVVAIKQVAALDDDFELLDGGVDPGSLERDLNEWDAFSLEAALQLAEAGDGVEVVVVTVGDDESEAGLLACLARGADRAIRVRDDALSAADPMVVARCLAPVVKREAPDLVLCGAQSSDAMNGATGVALAGLTGMASAAVVRRIELEGDRLLVERELEGGLVEVLRLATPALLTVQSGINEPRHATLRAIKRARDKPLELLEPADLGLDPDVLARAGARVRRLRPPERGAGADMLDGSPAELAERIAEIVAARVSA